MIYINLLPVRATQKREKLIEQCVVLGVTLVLVLAACIGVYAVLLSKILIEKNEISKKEAQIAALQPKIAEVRNFENLQKQLRTKLDILDKLKAGRTGPVHLLDELANAVPRAVWLEMFKEDAGAGFVTGLSMNEEGVATFLQNLDASPYIKNAELKTMDQTVKSSSKLKRFDISFKTEAPAQTNQAK